VILNKDIETLRDDIGILREKVDELYGYHLLHTYCNSLETEFGTIKRDKVIDIVNKEYIEQGMDNGSQEAIAFIKKRLREVWKEAVDK